MRHRRFLCVRYLLSLLLYISFIIQLRLQSNGPIYPLGTDNVDRKAFYNLLCLAQNYITFSLILEYRLIIHIIKKKYENKNWIVNLVLK